MVELRLTAVSNGAFNRFGNARRSVRADYICSALAPKKSERFGVQRTARRAEWQNRGLTCTFKDGRLRGFFAT